MAFTIKVNGTPHSIEVDGDTATAELSEPQGARFLLVKVGSDWRIDSGYTLH